MFALAFVSVICAVLIAECQSYSCNSDCFNTDSIPRPIWCQTNCDKQCHSQCCFLLQNNYARHCPKWCLPHQCQGQAYTSKRYYCNGAYRNYPCPTTRRPTTRRPRYVCNGRWSYNPCPTTARPVTGTWPRVTKYWCNGKWSTLERCFTQWPRNQQYYTPRPRGVTGTYSPRRGGGVSGSAGSFP